MRHPDSALDAVELFLRLAAEDPSSIGGRIEFDFDMPGKGPWPTCRAKIPLPTGGTLRLIEVPTGYTIKSNSCRAELCDANGRIIDSAWHEPREYPRHDRRLDGGYWGYDYTVDNPRIRMACEVATDLKRQVENARPEAGSRPDTAALEV